MPTIESAEPYPFFGRQLLPYRGNIAEAPASVIVNTTGPTAQLSNPLSKAITQAAGGKEVMRAYLHDLLPIREGTVAITPAGKIRQAKYIFHVVPTATAKGRTASDEYIGKLTRRVIELADLLEMPSIAIPPMGGGRGRATKEDVVRVILEAGIDSLAGCQYLQTIVFATTDEATYRRYHNHIVVSLALKQRQKEIVALLPLIQPALYGDVGRVWLQMEALRERASQITDDDQFDLHIADLRTDVAALVSDAGKLIEALPANKAETLRAVIATGQTIVNNVAIAQGAGAVAASGGVAVGGNVYGDIQAVAGPVSDFRQAASDQ